MLHSPFAEFVPLPDVAERTEGRIMIGSLGLPGDLDPSEFLLNIAGVARTATVAGIGEVSIIGGPGERDQVLAGFRGINGDGTLSLGGLVRVQRAPLYSDIQQDVVNTPSSAAGLNKYYRPYIVKLNMTAIGSRAKEGSGKKESDGEYSSKRVARFMNLGLQDALWEAGVESHRLKPEDLGYTAVLGAMTISGTLAADMFLNIPEIAGASLGAGVTLATFHLMSKWGHYLDVANSPSELPPRIRSIIPRVTAGRIPLTGIMAYSTRMVRAAEPSTKKIIL